jgi:ABC-type transport system involved in multi-copper enzyme maturation permease subunit
MSGQPEVTRWSAAGVIAWREARATLRGASGYVGLTIALIAAAWMLLIDVRALKAAGLLVRADPFRAPAAAALLVLALFLAVSAAVSAARDRESGTLEVLFYGPVDEVSYILGKVGGLLVAYVAALPLLLLSLLLLAWVSGFTLTPVIIASLALSIIPAAEIAGFGILLSVGTDRVRSAVLLLLGVAVVLLGVNLAYRIVLLVPIEDPASPVLPLRDTLAGLDLAVSWIAPFTYLERIVDGVMAGAWRTVLVGVASALAYTAAMIGLAAFWLRRRGVHRRQE